MFLLLASRCQRAEEVPSSALMMFLLLFSCCHCVQKKYHILPCMMILLLPPTCSRAQQCKHLLWVQTLFFSLAILFWLLAGGVVNALLHKARAPCPSVRYMTSSCARFLQQSAFTVCMLLDWCCFLSM